MASPENPSSWHLQSALPGVAWPALPVYGAAAALGLLHQMEETQWLPAARLAELQRRQLEVLLRHAYETAPYYRARRGKAPDAARLADLPVLTRRELQEHYESLKSERLPSAHGAVSESSTSGSTGAPVRVLGTMPTGLLWNVFTLRDHLWQRRDMRGKLAVIRHGAQASRAQNWGQATAHLVATGPAVSLGIDSDVDTQIEWLQRERPEYLLTYPSLAAELAKTSLARAIRLPQLREVRTFGEMLGPQVRELCRRAWDAGLTDTYSAVEIGCIALQCPEHEHYHVQSEGVLVEILDDRGRPCAPGEVGRVVITVLHNFATPLIRYEIGDFAELGQACPCGRGLPVLRRIAGRARNMLVTREGGRFWPYFGSRGLLEVAPVRQQQFVQKQFDLIEARLVLAAPLDAGQEERLRRHILSGLPAGMRLEFVYCDRIPRGAGGKFEDFVSEVGAR